MFFMIWFYVQGRPTQSMEEGGVKEYGAVDAKDYIPGAEVLKENDEKENEGTYNCL